MSAERQAKVAEAIKQEMASLMRDMKDPRIGFASIVRCEVTSDLRNAKIFVSVLGEQEAQRATLKALTGAAGYLRGALGQRLRLRYAPELVFRLDDSIAHGDRIARLLREVEHEHHGDE